MQAVIDGTLEYTVADSVAVSLFQRVHPELAVALDISDEQPVTWFSEKAKTIHYRQPCSISLIV